MTAPERDLRDEVTLYHYTCDHGRRALGDECVLLPAAARIEDTGPWTGELVWLTDLAHPHREGLGLTSHILDCDRTAHRYRVLPGALVDRWTTFARGLPRGYRESVEGAPGAMPAHWWVAVAGVPAVYDPIGGAA